MSQDTSLSPPQHGLRHLLAWCLITVSAPFLLLRGGTESPDRAPAADGQNPSEVADVKKAIATLQKERPDYIGIGNSMLYTRLGRSPKAMSELTDKRFSMILKNGSSSAIWYLMLKNIVAASEVKPKLVFFFIRDNELTAPLSQSSSNDSPYLLSLRGPEEPELDRLMGLTADGKVASPSVAQRLQGWFSFPAWEAQMPDDLADLAMDVGGLGVAKKYQRFALSDRFAVEHLRGDVAADKEAVIDPYNGLDSDHETSMANAPLTEMLKVAEQHGLKLLFFRVKRRPDAQGQVANEPATMRAYVDGLRTLIESHGALFFDESYDLAIRLEDYRDGDHIRSERMDWYRRYFWDRVKPLFP